MINVYKSVMLENDSTNAVTKLT